MNEGEGRALSLGSLRQNDVGKSPSHTVSFTNAVPPGFPSWGTSERKSIFGREGSQKLHILWSLISKHRPVRKGKLTMKLKGQLPTYI